jgi:hypothetical protein
VSAWGIGATAATRRGIGVKRAGADSATEQPPVPSVDTLVTWIPGEVVAAYAALVLALQPEATDGTDAPLEITWGGWVVFGVAFACAITFLGGWSKSAGLAGKARRELFARTALGGVAFVIWSAIIPGSWWYSIEQISENQAVVPIVVGVLGVTFGLAAEGIVRRLGGTT